MSKVTGIIRAAIFVGTDPDPGWPTPDHPECVKRADMVEAALANAGFTVVPREATDEMVRAGAATAAMNGTSSRLSATEDAIDVWQTMIDAALKPAGVRHWIDVEEMKKRGFLRMDDYTGKPKA